MQKLLVSLGVAWVGLSLIIGLVIAFKGIPTASKIDGTVVKKEVYYVNQSALSDVDTARPVTAQVSIGPVGPEAVAQVEVKK